MPSANTETQADDPQGDPSGNPNRDLRRELEAARAALCEVESEVEELRERVRNERCQRDELLKVVSHELRTPATVISGYNKLLLSGQVGPLNEEQHRFLTESSKSCQRLNEFIGNLVEVSCEVRGEAALKLGDASLEPLISGVADFLRPLLEAAGLRAMLHLDHSAVHARIDRSRIEQVLTNLVNNAIKYARAGEVVEISTASAVKDGRRFVEVAVSDRGPGIPAGDQGRVFAPYARLGRENDPGGLGLGLAICRRIVEAHGGWIEVGEREGGGSRFAFYVPAAEEVDEGMSRHG